MNKHVAPKRWLSIALVIIVIGALLAVTSLYPVNTGREKRHVIVDDSISLTSTEIYRQSLGTFQGGENITVSISSFTNNTVNFSILTYSGEIFSGVSSHTEYTFIAEAENYELEFNPTFTPNELCLEVTVQRQEVQYPFAWLSASAKSLFFSGVIFAVAVLLKNASSQFSLINSLKSAVLSRKNKRLLLILVLASLVLWMFVVAQNNAPFATLENWFTDHARHAYTSTLFFKDGFSIFGTPLRNLANLDFSTYKFVTWPETPHIYPIGSVFLFLPFGVLLEQGIHQVFVFKMEIVFFLLIAHICLYFFLKRFLPKEMNLSLKVLGIFIFYLALVVYAANGMFDTVAFLFAFAALTMFLGERYDYFLLLSVISVTVKYQAGIVLLPLMIFGLLKFLGQTKFSAVIRNKAVIAAGLLTIFDSYTVYLSAPFLASTRSEFVINGINLFSPHVQLPYASQSLAVLLTLTVTLGCAIYLRNKDSFISLSMIFIMLPVFSMPFFQFWYLPYFFIYAFIPRQKRVLEVTMLWLIFITVMISLGPLSYNPFQIFGYIGKIF